MEARSSKLAAALDEEPIPTYTIDLSLPPSERYTKLATDFGPRMKDITPLFDEVLASFVPWWFLRRFIELIASLVLRRVYSSEETQELRGIAKASGVKMYFLVALNVLLDSLLGCTSGGVLTQPQNSKSVGIDSTRRKERSGSTERSQRMMHFRTLDWGMGELRSVLVVLEFVRSKSEEPEKVIGRSISYAGFAGVLTGVRENLSISLNFRPNHNCSTFSLRIHQILVLFGFRPSIVSVLRNNFFIQEGRRRLAVEDIARTIVKTYGSPCYVILSSPSETMVVEKDLLDGKIRSARNFIVHTNHDIRPIDPLDNTYSRKEKNTILGMEATLEESEERRDCIQKKWNSLAMRQERKMKEEGEEGGVIAVREKTLQGWVKAYPIMNECTHFGCILDPKTGTIRWLQRGIEEEEDRKDSEE